MKTADLIQIWKDNTPPPDYNTGLYDAEMTMSIKSTLTILRGNVEWNADLRTYVFSFTEHQEGPVHKLIKNFAIYEQNDYLAIRDNLRIHFGIYYTRGIYDEFDHLVFPGGEAILLHSETESIH